MTEERLPQNYVPTHYELFIHIVKDEPTFNANVTITFQKNQTDEKVILHISPNISIQKITQNEIPLEYTIEYPKLTIQQSTDPSQEISSYPIKIDYLLTPIEFDPDNKPQGFYKYKDSYLTKFETRFCRRLLPCFDEPCIRAIYKVKLIIPSELTGISNMPIESTIFHDTEKELTFLPTPPINSYILCICVGNFGFIEGRSKSGIPVKFYSAKGKEEAFRNYLDEAIFTVDWMEAKIGVKYELPHLQLLSYGGIKIGMENYGLITLCDYSLSTTQLLRSSKVVMHETVHQWFGDLVSIKWWDSVWLNEGFAQFFQYLVLNDYEKLNYVNKGIKHFIELNGFGSLRFFGQDKICPEPSEIDFSKRVLKNVIYIKGAFVLKMFLDIVGEEAFYSVCSNWCQLYKNKCAEAAQFVEVANSTLNADFSQFFNVWLRSVGYPALFVTHVLNESEGSKYSGISVVQENVSGAVFHFNLKIVYEENGEIKSKVIFVTQKETKIDLNFDWVIVNDELESLCAVIYTKELLDELVEVKNKGKLSHLNCDLISRSPKIVSPHFNVDETICNLASNFIE